MLATGQRTHFHDIWSRNIFPFSMEGCVLYLPLWQEDMQGTTLLSYDQYYHSCTPTTPTWGVQGRSFNGVDDYITIPYASSLNPTAYITLEGWIRLAGNWSSAAIIIGNMFYGAPNSGYELIVEATREVTFLLSTGSIIFSIATIDKILTGTWMHVVGTYNQQSLRIFLNGILSIESARTGVLDPGVLDTVVGRRLWGSTLHFNGDIGEVRIYSRALTPLEVQHKYLATKWRYQ